VHEYIGGKLNKLRIHFVPPETYFGEALGGEPSAVAICARAGLLERPIDLSRMVHLARDREWGCELHSRFWLGYVEARDGARLPGLVGNRPWVRRRAASMTLGRALAVHCHEEMTTLASFLPDLHGEESAGPRAAPKSS
jgi:hypothetical protein